MLRQLGALFAIVVSALAAHAESPAAPAARIDLERAREHFALAERLSDADGGALWGEALYGPILLVDPQTRELVSNVRNEGLAEYTGWRLGGLDARRPCAGRGA